MRALLCFLASMGCAPLAAEVPLAAETPHSAATMVLARPVAAGALLSPADFTLAALASADARGALTAEAAAGLEARRALLPGRPVRGSDVIAPQLVRRNQPVTMLVSGSGFVVRAEGRALASAALGETVRVIAPATNRTVAAVVTGPGLVQVTAP